MNMTPSLRNCAAALVAAFCCAGHVLAQTAFPAKPIKAIVPFPPGGGGDTLARQTLARIAAELGQPIAFENIAGAGGNLGSVAGARAEADGHTWLYATNGTLAINHALYKAPGFEPLRDFAPVGRLSQIGLIVVVKTDAPARTMQELVAQVRARPDRYSFGSAGNGTTGHLSTEILKSRLGLAIVHIPYRGNAAALTDLIGGQTDLMIEVMPAALPHVRGGRLRALAVTTPARSTLLPELPTVAESVAPGYATTAWDALVVPAATPPAVIARIGAATRAALADAALIQRLAGMGAEPTPSSAEELAAFVRSENERWGQAVRQSGAKVD